MIRGPKGHRGHASPSSGRCADSSERRSLTLVRDEIKLEDQEAKGKLFECRTRRSTARLGLIDLSVFYASFDLGKFPGTRPTAAAPPRTTGPAGSRSWCRSGPGHHPGPPRNGGGFPRRGDPAHRPVHQKAPSSRFGCQRRHPHRERHRDTSLAYDTFAGAGQPVSASASEILARALQELRARHPRGRQNTHGKGRCKTIYELNKVSRRFPPPATTPAPSGHHPQVLPRERRVHPAPRHGPGCDPSLGANEMDVGEGLHSYPLPWDTIPGPTSPASTASRPVLEEIRRRSERPGRDRPGLGIRGEDITAYTSRLRQARAPP